MAKNKLIERAEAGAEVVAGKLKEAVGRAIGNDGLVAEGEADQLVGHARDEAAKASERASGAVDEVIGEAKDRAGGLVGDAGLQVEGKVQRLRGKARRAANK